MEVTLKKNLKIIVDDDKRFFICYYPPDLSPSDGCKFKFKYLECGTLKEVLSDSIDDIMYKPVEEDVYAATAATAAAAATIPYDPREEFFKNIRDYKSYWASTEDWKRDVRKLRLDMKRIFDSKTKLDVVCKAFLNYLPFDMLYPSKSDQLNDEINKLCDLSSGKVPTLPLDKTKNDYFIAPPDHPKTTTSYLNLADLIKTHYQVSLKKSPFAKCLNESFLSPQCQWQLRGDILTLDQLIECMDLLTTPIASVNIIRQIAAHPFPPSHPPPTRPRALFVILKNLIAMII